MKCEWNRFCTWWSCHRQNVINLIVKVDACPCVLTKPMTNRAKRKKKNPLSDIQEPWLQKGFFKSKIWLQVQFQDCFSSQIWVCGLWYQQENNTCLSTLCCQFWIDTVIAYFNLFISIHSSAAAYFLLFSNWEAATSFVTEVCNLVPASPILTLYSFYCLWEFKSF